MSDPKAPLRASPAGQGLGRFLTPRSIAIVGASADPDALAGKPIRYLRRHGFPGRILPVNPRHASLSGLPCVPRLRDASGPIDLVIVAVRAALAGTVLQEAAELGIPYAIVIGSGFSEAGPAGARLEAGLAEIARAGGIRVLGPNTQGFVNVAGQVAASFSEAMERDPAAMRPGPLALVSQSGAFGFSAFSLAQERHIGVRSMVATGNEADLTVSDFLGEALDDPSVGTLAAYVEGVRDPESLRGVAERAAHTGVPLALIRGGRSAQGARAARHHTAAPHAPDRFFRSLHRDFGVVLAEDLGDVFDLARLVERTPRTARPTPAGPAPAGFGVGVGIVSISGGAGVLAADVLVANGVRVPPYAPWTRRALQPLIPSYGSAANPTDVTAQVLENVERFEEILGAVARDPSVGALLVIATMVTGERGRRTMEGVVRTLSRMRSEGRELPCAMAYTTPVSMASEAHALAEREGVALYETPRRAALALAALLSAGRGGGAVHRVEPPESARSVGRSQVGRQGPRIPSRGA